MIIDKEQGKKNTQNYSHFESAQSLVCKVLGLQILINFAN